MNQFFHRRDYQWYSKKITNFTKSCFCLCSCRFYKRNWMNFWWHGTVGMSGNSSGSRWCSWSNISYDWYSELPKSGNCCRKAHIDVVENALGIDLLTLFPNKDLCELFECYVHSHSVTLPEDPESGIQFYVDVLIFLQNDGFTMQKIWFTLKNI